MKFWLLLAYARAALAYSCCSGSCTATTTTGKYVGAEDGDGVRFLSVRYAEPPVGSLRFADPVPFVPTQASYAATALPPFCIQYTDNQSEDCLFLNVFRPRSGESLPVMFWVHGGSLMYGGTADPTIYGATLARAHNIIVVTVQYRLGLLGLYDDGATTNFAIKDVILALKWVQANARAFGGDPAKVTVAGQSSGGTLIRALLSSNTNGLFRGAILMSDPMGYGFNKRSTSAAITAMVYNSTGCADLECMRSLPLDDILAAQAAVASDGHAANPAINYAQPLSPVIDGALIRRDFSSHVASGSLPVKVPLLAGTVADEANAIIESVLPDPVSVAYYPFVLQGFMGTARAAAILASLQFAPDVADPDGTRLESAFVAKLFYWTCAVQRLALAYSRLKPVYIYETTKGIAYPSTAGLELCQGSYVCHQADIEPLFGTYANATAAQVAVAAEIQERWVQFVKTGTPNAAGYPAWKPISSILDLNLLKIGQGKSVRTLYPAKCDLVFGSLVKYDYQMYSN